MRHFEAPVLFLPGTLCDERIWMPLWKQLSFTDSNRCYVPLQWANDVEQMLSLTFDRINRYSQPVHLVGFSMGGYIASLAALDSRNVASLTLIGYNPTGLNKEEEQQRLSIIKAINNNSYSKMSKSRLGQFVTEEEIQDATITDVVTEMSVDLGPATLKTQFIATTPRKDLTGRLAKLRIPIHFITAEHDKIANSASIKALSDSLPHSRFDCLDNTAHMMLLSQAKLIASLLLPDLQSSANLG